MSAINLGIIGVGGFGLFSLEQYRQLPNLHICAIAGTHPDKYAGLAREYDIPFFTTDWRELATHPSVDVVYIATPPSTHAEMASVAIIAGKHVFCEKPMALTLEDADRMLAQAEAHRVRIGTNFVMRYSAIYAWIRTIIQERLLGESQRCYFENHAGNLPGGHWFWDLTRSGGILVEHGVHFFDIFGAIFGPARLHSAGMTQRKGGEADRWLAVFKDGDLFGSFYHAFDKP